MAVLIVQSRATAHVYRIFGALIALLILMAAAVGVMRFRSDRLQAPSPYGALGTAAPAPSAADAEAQRLAAAVKLPTAAQPAAAPQPPVILAAAAAAPVAPTSILAATNPVPAPAADITRNPPRLIAIDKAAAASPVPQPAPPAVVEAATRSALAPPPPPAPVAETPAAPAAATQVVTAEPAPPAPKPPGGLININTASVDELNSIPGGGRIGRTIARHRPYRSLQDLVDHRVLKARDFERIRAALTTE